MFLKKIIAWCTEPFLTSKIEFNSNGDSAIGQTKMVENVPGVVHCFE